MGRPPGPAQQQAAQKRRQDRQINAVSELASQLPGGLKGKPVLFNDGIPQIDDEPIAQLTEAEQAALSGRSIPAHEIAAQVAATQPGPPVQQPPQQYAPPVQPSVPDGQVVAKKVRDTHPVLQRLRKSFGLTKERRYPLEIFHDQEKFTYLMAPISDDFGIWSIMEAQKRMLVEGEAAGTSWFRLLSACASVLAIDGVAIHEIYGYATTPEEDVELIKDKFNIPNRLRKLAALDMARELWESTDQVVGDKLDTFYQSRILAENRTMSSYDKEFEGAYRYVCPIDECKEVHLSKPQYDASGQETPFFCRFHGAHLTKTLSLSAEINVPLA